MDPMTFFFLAFSSFAFPLSFFALTSSVQHIAVTRKEQMPKLLNTPQNWATSLEE
jgi:hypothetical protein